MASKDKYQASSRGCLLGLAAGDSLANGTASWAATHVASCLATCPSGTNADEAMARYASMVTACFLNHDGKNSGVASRSIPIGLWFHEDVPNIVQYGITTASVTSKSELDHCASVSSAMLCSIAMSGVPVGLWGHELMLVVGGINDEFSRVIDVAIGSVGKVRPGDAMPGIDNYEAVAAALCCCMSYPNDFKSAVMMAPPGEAIAITGALMGTRLGVGAIPDDMMKRVANVDELIRMADAIVGNA